MKLLLFFIFFAITISVFGQNRVISKGKNSILSEKERWDVNKYVWSHTNYKTGKADKPVLDFEAIEHWRSLGSDKDLSISPDGRFFAYSVKNSHLNPQADSIVVQAVQGNWRRAYPGAALGFFSGDSRQYIFQSNDELIFLQIGDSQTSSVKGIVNYQLPEGGIHEWLAYLLKGSDRCLVVKNLLTAKEKRFSGVSSFAFHKSGRWLACQLKNETNDLLLYRLGIGDEQDFPGVLDYKFDESGQVLILKTEEKSTTGRITALKYSQLSKKSAETIWSTTDTAIDINSYSLDGSGQQVVFMVTDKDTHNSIWYYRVGMNRATMKANDQGKGIDAGLTIAAPPFGTPYFTDNSRYIMFSLQPQSDHRQPDAEAVLVDVWSHHDTLLQSAQAESPNNVLRMYRAVIQIDSVKIIRLEKEYEFLKTFKLPGDFAVVGKISELMNGDRYWTEGNYYDSNWLVSLKDGSRTLLPTRSCNYQGPTMSFSPGGRYLVYFDAERDYNYFSYDLLTGKAVNMSSSIPARQLGLEDYYHRPKGKKMFAGRTNYGIAAWFQGDKGILVYDDYDIWQLDLSGKKDPVNITNGHGRKQQMLLGLEINDRFNFDNAIVLSGTDTLLLKAFSRQNQHNGFYHKILGQSGDPELLYMGPYFFQTQALLKISGFGDLRTNPSKAASADTWIVKRQSATDAPNYFVTNDFKKFTRLTDIQPQKNYNWLTSELHPFRQIDGTISQGVLYKPENFHPTKKYPVIISFYFQHSNQLNVFPVPELLSGPLDYCNPAWFVSHGYIVFCPDIYFKDKAYGPSVLNTIEGAARYLGGLSYVDGMRIGLSGHSNSGRMAYYALTHSQLFAAMSIGSGALGPDFISSALSFEDYLTPGRSALRAAERDLGNLWDNKAIWLDHTAVLHADKVTSPLLLFFNEKDLDPVARGAELFISLRRLEKKVWWLNYNQEGHTLHHPNALKDYTIRYTQFFDHYLKGAPAPKWMTNGIPYKVKAIESRYDLNPRGSCGINCPVCGTSGRVNH